MDTYKPNSIPRIMSAIIVAFAMSSCRCNDSDLVFTIGGRLPPYPNTELVESNDRYDKYLVKKMEPCGDIHSYFITTDKQGKVISMWRRW